MEGKIIAITGGASGIGLSLAHLLAKRGAKLSIADVSKDNLDKAVEDIKKSSTTSSSGALAQVIATQCDVRDLAQVQAWLKETYEHFGRLDGAANLAGVSAKTPGKFAGTTLEDADEDDWEFVLAVNLTGVMHCMKAELKLMRSGASIVNASSIAGLRGMPSAAYCASKHGVVGLTRAAAKEYGQKGIRINAVAPGLIDTPMLREAASGSAQGTIDNMLKVLPIQRCADPEEVAKVIAFLLGDESSFVTGAIWSVDGGWNV